MSKLTSDQNPTILKKVGFQQQAAACIIKLKFEPVYQNQRLKLSLITQFEPNRTMSDKFVPTHQIRYNIATTAHAKCFNPQLE